MIWIGKRNPKGDICEGTFLFFRFSKCKVKKWPDSQTCHQPIFTEKELQEILEKNPSDMLVGADTCLFHFQLARHRKDWEGAKEVQNKAKEMGFNLSFQRNYYSAHYR